jgi:hypothetical protein
VVEWDSKTMVIMTSYYIALVATVSSYVEIAT